MFHMDADIGVQTCGLIYMKGHVAHAGFPEISYGAMADKLVRAGYKVARVEQTETPAQLKERKASRKGGGPAPKVVNREVCSVLSLGTRTFCYLDEGTGLLDEAQSSDTASSVGPLLAIREILIASTPESDAMDDNDDDDDGETVRPVCEYGITMVDAVRGSVTIGQFADDVLRSRLATLLASFAPSEVLAFVCNVTCGSCLWYKQADDSPIVCSNPFSTHRFYWRVVKPEHLRLCAPSFEACKNRAT